MLFIVNGRHESEYSSDDETELQQEDRVSQLLDDINDDSDDESLNDKEDDSDDNVSEKLDDEKDNDDDFDDNVSELLDDDDYKTHQEDNIDDTIQSDPRIYNWFFNNNNDENNDDQDHKISEFSKLSLLEKNINLIAPQAIDQQEDGPVGSMYGTLNIPKELLCKLNDSYDETLMLSKRIKYIGDIPLLHKMFKYQLKEEVPGGALSQTLVSYLLTYADLLFDGQDQDNNDVVMSSILQHILHHLLYSRNKVIRNNSKIKMKQRVSNHQQQQDKRNIDILSDIDESKITPDQGYTRAKILILCPFRNNVYQIMESIQQHLGQERTKIINYEKFLFEYGPQQEHQESEKLNDKKPKDWKYIFQNNVDDDFKIGIQFNLGNGQDVGQGRGCNIRMYSDFYQSDLIIASPLGLRLIMEKSSSTRSVNYDYLSSLEIVYLHQTDVMILQNSNHIDFVLKYCNQTPVVDHGVDFERIRPYFLEENVSKRHRQVIISSQFNDPIIQSIYRQYGCSKSGQLRLRKHYNQGSIEKVSSKVKQIFNIIPTTTKELEDNKRFDYFMNKILLHIIQLKQKRTLIVTPSYLHYVRIRNDMIKKDVNACYICEYSRESEISRSRSRFFQGYHDVLLYSGRLHFFRRFIIRGVCHIIFYSLPEYCHFYYELVNILDEGESIGTITSCVVLCTKYEKMALERIVGTKQCNHMLQSHTKLGKTTFMFC